jgi:hypothetical protein
MRWNLKLNSIIISLCLLAVGCSETEKKPDTTTQKGRTVTPETSLQFISESGEIIQELNIELADEPMERNQGLMDVNEMPENVGMLFVFDEEAPRSFWMANTPLPLDIMYVNSDSVIVRIYQNTTPFSETNLPSESPSMYVVETIGGYSVTHGITEGMKIRF